MNSKDVNKEIKKKIWPLLKENGFSQCTSRNAWRITEETIEVVNFQSFNSYIAYGVGCTTFSFSVNLGVYYKCFEKTPWFTSVSQERVQEYESHVRFSLEKHLKQAKLFHPYNNNRFHMWKKDRNDIWYVKEDGSNLEEVIEDAKKTIISKGFEWFNKKTNLPLALKAIEKEKKGVNGLSWANAEIISAIALRLNDPQRAIEAYEGIITNPFYIRIHDYDKQEKKPRRDDYFELAIDRLKVLKE